ncbi:hypothetical protein E3P99_00338 [Wallemia hederae]|uniref:PROP1-like PPR domain-containing protein n=1 Tax=Wallemia hederae TaxID=1540922 RepID=A0A4T0G1G9_9BASI|nr:hypothetical protein E3P99_00338 [Wallemia hederae]
MDDYRRITRLFKDLFKADRKPTKSKSLEMFTNSLNRKNPSYEILSHNYHTVKATSTKDKSGVSPSQLLHTMKLLSKSTHEKDLVVLHEVFDDVDQFWGVDKTPRHHQLLIIGLIHQRKLIKALDLFETHLSHLEKHKIFSLLLASCSTLNDYESYQRVMQLLHTSNTPSDLHIYNARLKLAFQFHDLDFVHQLSQQMADEGYAADSITNTILLDGYSRWGAWEECARLENTLRSSTPDLASWTCILMARGRQHGLDAAKEVIDEIFEAGLHPNDITLSHLITLSPTPPTSQAARTTIEDLGAITGVDPDKHAYQAMVEKLLSVSIDEAYNFYMASPIRVLSSTYPIMTALSRNADASYSSTLHRMLSIYEQLDNRTRLDTVLLAQILRVCAKAGDVQTAINLLVEMKENHITLDTQFQTSFVITLLHASRDYYQAFRLYANVVDSKSSSIDGDGFASIIAEFCGLEFKEGDEELEVVPAVLFSEILNDMRKAGYPPSAKTYTTLLDYYARVKDAHSIAKIETLLNVDKTIKPDIYLYNALLNAHNRVGGGARCVELFNALLFSNRVDNASLSIVLDCTGNRATPADPISIYKNASRFISPNRKNWETLIEVLVRRRRFDDAWEVLRSGDFDIDQNALQVLFKMTRSSRDDKQLDSLRQRLASEYPQMWDEIKESVDIPWK